MTHPSGEFTSTGARDFHPSRDMMLKVMADIYTKTAAAPHVMNQENGQSDSSDPLHEQDLDNEVVDISEFKIGDINHGLCALPESQDAKGKMALLSGDLFGTSQTALQRIIKVGERPKGSSMTNVDDLLFLSTGLEKMPLYESLYGALVSNYLGMAEARISGAYPEEIQKQVAQNMVIYDQKPDIELPAASDELTTGMDRIHVHAEQTGKTVDELVAASRRFAGEVELQIDRLILVANLHGMLAGKNAAPDVYKQLRLGQFVDQSLRVLSAISGNEDSYDVVELRMHTLLAAVYRMGEKIITTIPKDVQAGEGRPHQALRSWLSGRQSIHSLIGYGDDLLTASQPEHSPVPQDEETNASEAMVELVHQLTELESTHAALVEPFRKSTKFLRKQPGYPELRHMLEAGQFTDGVTSEEAVKLVGVIHNVLERLQHISGAEVAEVLHQTLATEDDTLTLHGQLLDELRQVHFPGVTGNTRLAQNALSNQINWLQDRSDITARMAYNARIPDAHKLADVLALLAGATLKDVSENFDTAVTAEPLELSTNEQTAQPETDTPPEKDISVPEQPVPVTVALSGLRRRLFEKAELLDWVAFPPGTKMSEVRERTQRDYSNAGARIKERDWARIEWLLDLTEAYDGNFFRGKPGDLGATEPYFFADVTIDGVQFAIGEHPVWGNATYVLRKDMAYGNHTWEEIYKEPREAARLFGAIPVKHVPGKDHISRVIDKIQSLMTVKVTGNV